MAKCVSFFIFLSSLPFPTDTPESSDSGLAVPQESSRQEPPPPAPPPTEEPQSHILSSLRLENQLLRSEVASLNQEMASVIQRAKDLQEGKRLGRIKLFWPHFLHLPLFKWFVVWFSRRFEPDTSTCRQMELGAVSDWQDVEEPSVTGRRPDGSPLCQRWSTCSLEGQTWWSRSAAKVPQCCFGWGTEGKVKVTTFWREGHFFLFVNFI